MLSPMHASELVELAGMVATHCTALTDGCRRIPTDCIEQYWTCSKVRLDHWARTLKGGDVSRLQLRGTIEEILAGEVLTRIWTAVLSAYDRRRGTDEAEPVARSVMIGHAEARRRALTLLLRVSEIDAQTAVELNRLRRHAERWTELLLEEVESPETFLVNHPTGRSADKFQAPFSAASPNPDLNSRIAASIVGCFPEEVFNRDGLCFSLWFARVMGTADDAQSMIDRLLTGERSFGG